MQAGRLPVRFLLNGRPTDTLLGIATSDPLRRHDESTVLAPVWIGWPSEGEEVTSPFTVSGMAAEGFEANIQWYLLQDGEEVGSGSTTGGLCCTTAPYSFTVEAPPGEYTIIVREHQRFDRRGLPAHRGHQDRHRPALGSARRRPRHRGSTVPPVDPGFRRLGSHLRQMPTAWRFDRFGALQATACRNGHTPPPAPRQGRHRREARASRRWLARRSHQTAPKPNKPTTTIQNPPVQKTGLPEGARRVVKEPSSQKSSSGAMDRR